MEDYDLAWLKYVTSLNEILPVDDIYACISNYLDRITLSRLTYYAKNDLLTSKKYTDIKNAWNSFLLERPDGRYYIPKSGNYKLTSIEEVNTLFTFELENTKQVLKLYSQ